MMEDLEKKLMMEMDSNNSIIICCRFALPNIKPTAVIGGGNTAHLKIFFQGMFLCVDIVHSLCPCALTLFSHF